MIKKVLYISTASNISGATLALLEMCEAMRKKGVEPVVVTANRGEFEKRLKERGIRFYKVLYASWLCYEGEYDTPKGKLKLAVKTALERFSERRIKAILQKEKPDAVHINTGISPVGLRSAKECGIPLIWHIREIPRVYFDRDPYDPVYEKACLRKADTLIAVSDYVKQAYAEKSSGNLIRLYDGIDLSAYSGERTVPVLSGETVRLTLCGGIPVKGHEDAIRAVSELKARGISDIALSFWGQFEEKYRKRLESLIKELGVENSIVFAGMTKEMPKKWAETDIALMCSTGEALGRVTVEAMAAGALVIGADAGATPELLAEGRGVLYPLHRPERLADAIEEAMKNPQKAIETARKGQAFALSGIFATDRYADALLDIYQRAADGQ